MVGNRVVNVGLVAAALALLLMGKAEPARMEAVRAKITDVAAPVLDALSRPAASTRMAVTELNALANIRTENQRLMSENERLLQWQVVARKLETENRQLKGLLNFEPGAEPGFITARIIADTGGSFVHSVMANAGRRQGVVKGQAVITGDGLFGRVQGAGAQAARILLITDLNSRIPVVVESSRVRAILAGDNTERAQLIHLAPGAIVGVGDRIVTSGHGGAFPPGIPVGLVTAVGEAGPRVQPFVKRERAEFVRIVNYGLQGLLDARSAAEGAGVNARSGAKDTEERKE